MMSSVVDKHRQVKSSWSWLVAVVIVTSAAVLALKNCSGERLVTEMIPVVPRRSVPFAVAYGKPEGSVASTSSFIVATAETEAATNWESERWSNQANARLDQLAQWLTRREANELPVALGRGASPFAEALADGIPVSTETRISFKIVHVQVIADGFETTVSAELAYPAESPTHQRNSQWQCQWLSQRDGGPMLDSTTLISSEELQRPESQSTPWFVDVTASVLADEANSPQHTTGIDGWSQRLTRIDEMTLQGHHGLAVGDVNGDALEDLYVCDGGGLPNRLYLQQADGTLEDISARSRTDWLESSSAALLVDLDNDGDEDLVVATVPLILFSENDGSGRFEFRGGHEAVPSAYTLAAADYDNDGDLDLYATNYSGRAGERMGARGFEAQAPLPFHDANNGGRNALLENQGDFEFHDVTERVGLDANNRRFSFSAAWEDYDNDGDQDLYVANDFGRNNLYKNNDGAFVDQASRLKVEDIGAGMSVDWADCNRDGNMDLYVGNMFSAAGNRVTFQSQFSEQREEGVVADVQRMARGNSLFLGVEDASFRDVSLEADVTVGQWAWSSKFVDFNNDGWQDLLVANGYLTNRRPDDL